MRSGIIRINPGLDFTLGITHPLSKVAHWVNQLVQGVVAIPFIAGDTTIGLLFEYEAAEGIVAITCPVTVTISKRSQIKVFVIILFESVVGGEKVGRYSFIAINPFGQLSASGSKVTIQRSGQWLETECENPFDRLREELRSIEVAQLDEMPPFVGGAVGYAGYDTIRYVEKLPNAPEDDRELPDLSFAFYDQMIVFDNVQKTMTVIVLAKTNRDPARAETAPPC